MVDAEVHLTALLRRNATERQFWQCQSDIILDVLSYIQSGDLRSCMLSCRGLRALIGSRRRVLAAPRMRVLPNVSCMNYKASWRGGKGLTLDLRPGANSNAFTGLNGASYWTIAKKRS